jgi:hypothetical protein
MSRDYVDLYDGSLRANRVGEIERNGIHIDIIRPGYDAQGRRRVAWTQFVVDGVPIFETKIRMDTRAAVERFDKLWTETFEAISDDIPAALEACRRDHLSKFRDGSAGEPPAPSLAHDGRPDGKRYPA